MNTKYTKPETKIAESRMIDLSQLSIRREFTLETTSLSLFAVKSIRHMCLGTTSEVVDSLEKHAREFDHVLFDHPYL